MGNLKKIKVLFTIGCLMLGFLSGCNSQEKGEIPGDKSKSKKIVQVGESILYADELQGLTYHGMNAKDSSKLVKAYIDSWINRELVLSEARQQNQLDKAEIKRKVQQYEYDLLRYALEQQHVNGNLDTLVKKEEIDAYFKNNKASLKLTQNIVKCFFMKIPLESIRRDSLATIKINQMLLSQSKNQARTLRDYCVKSAEFYHLNDSTWVGFETLISNSPFMEIKDKTTLLNQSKLQPVSRQDQQYVYYLKVGDFKLIDQEAPYDFLQPKVVALILQQRKVKLIQKLENDLLRKAKKSKKIKIY